LRRARSEGHLATNLNEKTADDILASQNFVKLPDLVTDLCIRRARRFDRNMAQLGDYLKEKGQVNAFLDLLVARSSSDMKVDDPVLKARLLISHLEFVARTIDNIDCLRSFGPLFSWYRSVAVNLFDGDLTEADREALTNWLTPKNRKCLNWLLSAADGQIRRQLIDLVRTKRSATTMAKFVAQSGKPLLVMAEVSADATATDTVNSFFLPFDESTKAKVRAKLEKHEPSFVRRLEALPGWTWNTR
jgi:hypothetical protein